MSKRFRGEKINFNINLQEERLDRLVPPSGRKIIFKIKESSESSRESSLEIEGNHINSVLEIVGAWEWEERCSVCALPIAKGEPIATCPECGQLAHVDHLLEWLHVKGVCPNCKSRLTRKDLSVTRF